MKALALILAFGCSQAVTWVDCCGGDFCAKQAPCAPQEQGEPEDTGCGGGACLHLAPQHDVQVHASAPGPVPSAAWVSILELPSWRPPSADLPQVRSDIDPGALHGPPRHLRFRVLLI